MNALFQKKTHRRKRQKEQFPESSKIDLAPFFIQGKIYYPFACVQPRDYTKAFAMIFSTPSSLVNVVAKAFLFSLC